MQNEEVDLQINVHGTGLIPALWNDGLNKKNNTKQRTTIENVKF